MWKGREVMVLGWLSALILVLSSIYTMREGEGNKRGVRRLSMTEVMGGGGARLW